LNPTPRTTTDSRLTLPSGSRLSGCKTVRWISDAVTGETVVAHAIDVELRARRLMRELEPLLFELQANNASAVARIRKFPRENAGNYGALPAAGNSALQLPAGVYMVFPMRLPTFVDTKKSARVVC
jgi:hypothetical protein